MSWGFLHILQLSDSLWCLNLFRGSSQQLWPVLGHAFQPVSPVFTVGLCCGVRQPQKVLACLDNLHEMRIILAKEIQLRRVSTSVRVHLASIISDAPENAMIKQVTYHTGYYSCPRFTVRGCNVSLRVVFTASKCRRIWTLSLGDKRTSH